MATIVDVVRVAMRLQLNWEDPERGPQQAIASPPIAFGRDISDLPHVLDGWAVERVVLNSATVSRLHAVIVAEGDGVALEDRSKNGTVVDGHLLQKGRASLSDGAVVGIGEYRLTVTSVDRSQMTETESSGDRDRTIVLNEGNVNDNATVILDEPANAIAPNATIIIDPESVPIRTGIPQSPSQEHHDDATVILNGAAEAIAPEAMIAIESEFPQPSPITPAPDVAKPGDDATVFLDVPEAAIEPNATVILDPVISPQIARSTALEHNDDSSVILDSPKSGVTNANAAKPSEAEVTLAPSPSESAADSEFQKSGDGAEEIEAAPPTGQAQDPKPEVVIEPQLVPTSTSALSVSRFPPPNFLEPKRVNAKELFTTGDPVTEVTFAALGGGLGSFSWVDALRIYGARSSDIAVISLDRKPYTRYKRLCENSQIPPHERLRSSSDSCPDNFWGWPGYAWREAWYKLQYGNAIGAAKLLWQVFAEPVLSDTYTPQSGRVFASLDREADRIGWQQMLRFGRIRGIRKTDDGRYAIAYSIPSESQRQHGYILAPYVHLATGYPGVRFLPDLQEYRARTKDFRSVVNAYEDHQHIYQHLEREGGTVIVRGRGIVASRIIQRLSEARQKNRNIKIVHLMRSSKTTGNRFGLSQRPVEHQWEFQPFNWPKAAWSGELREMFEKAGPEQRKQLLKDWGGTTTPSRMDWRQITADGLREGWYATAFGQVEKVDRASDGSIISYVKVGNFRGTMTVESDFIIDGTGLDANLRVNPLMDDLVGHYQLPLNVAGRLQVADDFELVEMRNERGKMFAAGVITLGGPNPAVDSFLGLQYSAQRSLDALVAAKAPGLKYVDGLGSAIQWCKWALNAEP